MGTGARAPQDRREPARELHADSGRPGEAARAEGAIVRPRLEAAEGLARGQPEQDGGLDLVGREADGLDLVAYRAGHGGPEPVEGFGEAVVLAEAEQSRRPFNQARPLTRRLKNRVLVVRVRAV
ncbi:hypothetical protein [Nonomuraea dietziae]|uniref:hypothetical protein n=1 Tax=Nonomuraea dietziae TaxID=65515 RepID=UPI00341A672A